VRGALDLSHPDAVRVETATRAALGEDFAEAARRGADATTETLRAIAAVTLGG
jgi:hypothetical protein